MNPYEILGVQKTASDDEIKKAYRKLALQYHPDTSSDPNAEDRFKEISASYDILSDPTKKQNYDQFGDPKGAQGPQFGGAGPFGFDFDFGFGDIFNRGPRRRQTSVRGNDVRRDFVLPFMDAIHGSNKQIKVEYPVNCIKCKGNGSKDGTALEQCIVCNGAGKTGVNKGFLNIMTTCHACGGAGQRIKEKCPSCSGQGTDYKKEVLTVTIPAGADDGMVLRLTGKGMPSPYGAESGDLYLVVRVEPHAKFKRRDLDIYTTEEVDYLDAILGAEIKVQTVHDKVKLKVPPGTQPNATLSLKQKGVIRNKSKGNHLVKVNIKLPTKLGKEDAKLLEQLRKNQK